LIKRLIFIGKGDTPNDLSNNADYFFIKVNLIIYLLSRYYSEKELDKTSDDQENNLNVNLMFNYVPQKLPKL